MPGFIVSGLGAGVDNTPLAYYKYTWTIDNVFGTMPGTTPVIVYAKEASLPSWDFEKDEVMGGSLKYKFAKSVIFNDVKISWYDTYGLASVIKKWRELVWSPATGLQNPDAYKTRSQLRALTYDILQQTAWLLYNSWPQSVKTGDLTYTDSDVKLVEVTVAYDWACETEGDYGATVPDCNTVPSTTRVLTGRPGPPGG